MRPIPNRPGRTTRPSLLRRYKTKPLRTKNPSARLRAEGCFARFRTYWGSSSKHGPSDLVCAGLRTVNNTTSLRFMLRKGLRRPANSNQETGVAGDTVDCTKARKMDEKSSLKTEGKGPERPLGQIPAVFWGQGSKRERFPAFSQSSFGDLGRTRARAGRNAEARQTAR
jgi:hypothetical protein